MSNEWMMFEFERTKSQTGLEQTMEHYCTVVVEQPDVNHWNYYRTKELHIHKHGQIHRDRVSALTHALERKGFVLLDLPLECEGEKKPNKYYYICLKEHNYVTNEITVFNKFGNNIHLTELVDRIPFEAMATKMTGEWHDILLAEEKKSPNRRGNLRINCGFTTTSRIDRSSVPGMNVPTRLRQCSNFEYIAPNGDENLDYMDEDTTFEETMINISQDITYLSDEISRHNGEKLIHNNCERNKTWATKVAEESGANVLYLRSDNASVFVTGNMPDMTNRQVSMHRDSQNDRRDGASDVVCVSMVVPLTYKTTGEEVRVRCAVGLYNKHGCGDVAEKLEIMKIPTSIVKEFMINYKSRSDYVTKGKVAKNVIEWSNPIDMVEMNDKQGWKSQWAHADKCVYYSYFMNIIVSRIIPVFGMVKAVLYEAIYATALTASQLGWKQGVEYAIGKRNNGKNFIVNWIEGQVHNHGHVGHGKYPRSMNSRGCKEYQLWKIYLSIYNLMRACEESDHIQPAKILRNLMKGPYTRRKVGVGMENVGMFQGQQIIHIVTLVNLMKNKNVTNHIGVAEGTETYQRLLEMDPNMDKVVGCILPVLAHALDIPCRRVVENLFCEALRWNAGGRTTRFTKHDIILKGMKLYQMKNEVLYKGFGGDTMKVENWMEFATFDGEFYDPLIKWWTLNPNFPGRVLGEEGETIVVSTI